MEPKRLYRSRKEKILGGVCGGIAEYFNIDPILVRMAAVLLALISMGAAIVVYIIMWIVVPERPAIKPEVNIPKKKK